MEEIARLHCRAGRRCKVEEVTLPCAFQHVELVRDDATHVIVSPQDVRKQDAVAASNMPAPPTAGPISPERPAARPDQYCIS